MTQQILPAVSVKPSRPLTIEKALRRAVVELPRGSRQRLVLARAAALLSSANERPVCWASLTARLRVLRWELFTAAVRLGTEEVTS